MRNIVESVVWEAQVKVLGMAAWGTQKRFLVGHMPGLTCELGSSWINQGRGAPSRNLRSLGSWPILSGFQSQALWPLLL